MQLFSVLLVEFQIIIHPEGDVHVHEKFHRLAVQMQMMFYHDQKLDIRLRLWWKVLPSVYNGLVEREFISFWIMYGCCRIEANCTTIGTTSFILRRTARKRKKQKLVQAEGEADATKIIYFSKLFLFRNDMKMLELSIWFRVYHVETNAK